MSVPKGNGKTTPRWSAENGGGLLKRERKKYVKGGKSWPKRVIRATGSLKTGGERGTKGTKRKKIAGRGEAKKRGGGKKSRLQELTFA